MDYGPREYDEPREEPRRETVARVLRAAVPAFTRALSLEVADDVLSVSGLAEVLDDLAAARARIEEVEGVLGKMLVAYRRVTIGGGGTGADGLAEYRAARSVLARGADTKEGDSS